MPTESELRERYENGLRSGSIYYDESLGRNENYEKWKYDTMKKSVNNYDWGSDKKDDQIGLSGYTNPLLAYILIWYNADGIDSVLRDKTHKPGNIKMRFVAWYAPKNQKVKLIGAAVHWPNGQAQAERP